MDGWINVNSYFIKLCLDFTLSKIFERYITFAHLQMSLKYLVLVI